MEQQSEFLFAPGPVPELHPPDPSADFHSEVAAAWQLPLGVVVRVDLASHDFSELQGRLELARAPELPFDTRQPLALRIGTIEFSSRQISGWCLV
ncbi:MAG: hypothetical protein FJ399_16605 [Verrucomicrobia bacterium]|nr:hypothetical protein [Verrucomicrobiota bacterium]